MTKFNLIAIDGELATGKTTISRLIAAQNNYILLSTGVLFRIIGRLIFEEPAIRGSLNIKDEPNFELNVDWATFFKDFKVDQYSYLDYLNMSWLAPKFRLAEPTSQSIKCSWKMFQWDFSAEIIGDEQTSGRYAGILAKVMPIRDWIKAYCHHIVDEFMSGNVRNQEWNAFQIRGAIMEGRDICWNMLPEANLKFYLSCSLQAKKDRRRLDFEIQNHRLPNEKETNQMFQSLEKRVKSDELILAPSKKLAGVIHVDTSDLTIQGELDLIQRYINK